MEQTATTAGERQMQLMPRKMLRLLVPRTADAAHSQTMQSALDVLPMMR